MLGSIPACAGETLRSECRRLLFMVYPRVCGGNYEDVLFFLLGRGLSPRVRGKRQLSGKHGSRRRSIPACAGETWMLAQPTRGVGVYPRVCGGNYCYTQSTFRSEGLSPRVRGKRTHHTPSGMGRRSIPACAGETWTGALPPDSPEVYPRVCGGNTHRRWSPGRSRGLSPRVRGKRWPQGIREGQGGSIPACAGETIILYRLAIQPEVYPRVCGGNLVSS